MADSAKQPNWSLLPHDPIAFFELHPDFERKALKRKYNQYIRQFKPEKFPAEFQKIRAAYEMLDGQLRYGKPPAATDSIDSHWGDVPLDTGKREPAPANWRKGPANEPISPLDDTKTPVYQRIESESPQNIFDELKQKSGKSPYEYFAMALIADVTSDDPWMFFKLLATGIGKHKHDPGLMNLLFEFLQQEFDANEIPVILRTLAKVVPNQQFYFLTEKLWDEFLRKTEFHNWAKSLKVCESQIDDFNIAGKLAFYIHVLPAAIFKADADWLDSKIAFIEQHNHDVPANLDIDLELVYQLVDYRKSHDSGPTNSPEIHKALREYFTVGGCHGDEFVINMQNTFARNPGILLNQFSFDAPHEENQLAIWSYINEEVCQRHGLWSQIDPRELRAKLFDLMVDLDRSENESFGWMEESRYLGTRFGSYAIVAIAPFIILSSWLSPLIFCLALTLAIGGVLAVRFLYRPSERYESFIEKRMKRTYLLKWRGRFVHLFEATQTNHYELSEAVIEIVETYADKVGFSAWLCRFLPADMGLYLFAMATRYLR